MADKILKSLNFGGADNYFPLHLVTAADNDKILSVVNGEWAVTDAPAGGSGQYVWSKHETENGKILEYVVGETEADYPDGGWKDGFWYERYIKLIAFVVGNGIAGSYKNLKIFNAIPGMTWEEFVNSSYNDGSISFSLSNPVYNNMCNTDITPSDVISDMGVYDFGEPAGPPVAP